MEIKRQQGMESGFDYQLIDDNKTLDITYGGNLDLYMMLGDRTSIPDDKCYSIDFDITKENYEIYSIFDTLYKEVITGDVYGPVDEPEELEEDEEVENFLPQEEHYFDTSSYQYHLLVDENQVITWVSDEGLMDSEDAFKFYKVDEDTYRLTFLRNDIKPEYGFKSASRIVVRICNSGSRYNPFNCPFMRMFQKLQNIDPAVHQINMEELLYVKRLKNN